MTDGVLIFLSPFFKTGQELKIFGYCNLIERKILAHPLFIIVINYLFNLNLTLTFIPIMCYSTYQSMQQNVLK